MGDTFPSERHLAPPPPHTHTGLLYDVIVFRAIEAIWFVLVTITQDLSAAQVWYPNKSVRQTLVIAGQFYLHRPGNLLSSEGHGKEQAASPEGQRKAMYLVTYSMALRCA